MSRCDYHTHTTFSDGRNTVEEMLQQAAELGLDTVAITDHFDPNDPRPKVNRLKAEELLKHFERIHQAAPSFPVKILKGIEITPLPDGSLILPPKVREACEIIITSIHYLPYEGEIVPGEFYNDRYWDMFKEIALNAALGEGTIFGHCEEYLPIERMIEGLSTTFEQRRQICRDIAERYFDRPYVEKLADCLRRSGKACELHCETRTPRGWVIDLMARKGVIFSPGSDAHRVDRIGRTEFAYEMAKDYGLQMLML